MVKFRFFQRSRTPSLPNRRQAGFSLLEALFAAALLVMAGGAFLRSLTAASVAGMSAAGADLGVRVARAKLDELQAAPMYRSWPLPGYHQAVAPGGSVDPGGTGVPGYVAWYDENGAETTEAGAHYELRWHIREALSGGGGRLAGLSFEVVALPAGDRRDPVVRLSSLRVANGA